MRPRPDAIVFDVDGVLVDTEMSYIEAVARTVQWLLVHDAGLSDDGPAVDRATVHEWKRTGLWNDDWDLCYAMYCWLITDAGQTTTQRRRSAEPVERAALRTLVDLDDRVGGGRRRTWEDVRGVFEEIYNGTHVAVARYGVEPRVRQGRGLAETERVLLAPTLLADLRSLGIGKVGIVTGRSRVDWSAVATRLPLPPDVAVATMEDGRKPDPAPLRKVVRELGPRSFISVGDTRTDLELVQRWNATDEGRTVPGTGVMLCPAEDEPVYRDLGGTLFIRSLAGLPALLGRSRPS
ncbi:MAG: HAD family hydrolase [Candidatus Limnocylindria bacterium]